MPETASPIGDTKATIGTLREKLYFLSSNTKALFFGIKKIWLARLAVAWRWLWRTHWRRLAKGILEAWKDISSLVWSLFWLAIVIVIVTLLAQGMMRRTISITAITVPKKLEENGFSPEVAAQRLRDAINDVVKSAKTKMKNPEIRLVGDDPNIVIPAVGLQLDTIISMMRTFFHSEYRKNISGDLTIRGEKLWLRLRLNGREFYSSADGVDPENPDRLFEGAARALLWKTQPFIVASELSFKEPAKALEKATEIIEQ
jgi:hypothetical protein